MTVYDRRTPYPYDTVIDGRGYMFARDENGLPLYEQEKLPFARNVVTPGATPYMVADPKLEAPRGFFRFDHGMGFNEEPVYADRDTPGYYYGLYIDSGNGYIENGPTVTSVTPTETGDVRHLFEFTVGGTRKVCALAGRYAKVRNADNAAGWATAKDFTAGKTPRRGVVYRGTQSSDYAFIAMDVADNYWVWDGTNDTTTFTQHASEHAIGFANHQADLWRVYRDANGNGYMVSKSYQGGTAATWSGGFRITDRSNPATDIAAFNQRLYVGAEQGLYAPAVEDLTSLEFRVDALTPHMASQRSTTNCVNMGSWYQFLIVPMAGSLFRYTSDGSFPEMGLGTLTGNLSEVQGVCTAQVGYKNWTLFACFYNAAQDASYLMRWGSWYFMDKGDGVPERVFIPGWHGALYKFSGVQINSMLISDAVSGNPRLWLGDDDGVIHYLTLPRYSMAWRADSGCSFNITNPGHVYFPIIRHGVPHETKTNLGVAVSGEQMATSIRYIDVDYRTNSSSSFGGGTNISSDGRFDSDPGGRLSFIANVSGKQLELHAKLTTTTTSTPAVLKAIAAYQAVRPTFKWVTSMSLRAGDGVTDHNQNPMTRISGEGDIRGRLRDVAALAGPVTVTHPYGDEVDEVIVDTKRRLMPPAPGAPYEWVISLQMVQHRDLTTYGTYGRLESYTYGALEAYTYGQLEQI